MTVYVFYIIFQNIHDGDVSLENSFSNVTVVQFDFKTSHCYYACGFLFENSIHRQFVEWFVIYLHTKFLKCYCSVALIICSTKLVAKESFVTAATWFYALWRLYLENFYTFPRSLTIYRFRALRPVLLLPYSFTF